MNLSYHEPGKPVLLTETRNIRVSAPGDDGTYHIDWASVFTAIADKVELNRTPLPDEKDGKSWGGYAGLSFRGRKGIQGTKYITTKGEVKLTQGRFRGKDVAVECSGILGDNVFGIAVLDHPGNLNSPTPWYIINRQMYFFSPAVICYGPYMMSKGDTFTLKYRIIVHPDHWDKEKLKHQYERFIAET